MSQPLTEDRIVAAHTALGQLLGSAEWHGMARSEIKALERAILPVLNRGSKVSHLRRSQMQRRAPSFPRNDGGKFTKRTADEALPF